MRCIKVMNMAWEWKEMAWLCLRDPRKSSHWFMYLKVASPPDDWKDRSPKYKLVFDIFSPVVGFFELHLNCPSFSYPALTTLKGRTSNGKLDIVYGGINSDVNRMESALKALELYPLGLRSSSVVWNWCLSFYVHFLLCFSGRPYKSMRFMC